MDFSEEEVRLRPRVKLKASVSLNMVGGGLTGTEAQPLSPIEYQFLLRRASAVTEEQAEVSSPKSVNYRSAWVPINLVEVTLS